MTESQQSSHSTEFRSYKPLIKMEGFLHLPINSRFNNQSGGVLDSGKRKVAFLDRDGVLVEDVHFVTHPMQLKLLPRVIEALQMLREDYFIVVVTNQSGIARGLVTEDELTTINGALVAMLNSENVLVDALYYCPHHPEVPHSIYGIKCSCRKPEPGMLRQAVQDWALQLSGSFMVGDRYSDVEAACRVGIKSVLVGQSEKMASGTCVMARDLFEATCLMLDQKGDSPVH